MLIVLRISWPERVHVHFPNSSQSFVCNTSLSWFHLEVGFTYSLNDFVLNYLFSLPSWQGSADTDI
jgi:hypothetical protein